MMAISNETILNTFYAIAPQFKNPTSDQLAWYNQIIAILRCQVNERILSCCGALAYAYLLAHMITVALAPTTGTIASMSEGDLSISFAVSVNSDILNSTSYGRAYLDLIKRTIVGSFVTNVPQNFAVTGFPFFNGGCGCGCE